MLTALQFLNKIPVIVLLLTGAIVNVTGDIAAKYWSQTPGRAVLYWVAWGLYAFSAALYIPTLLRNGLVVTSSVWSLFSIMGYMVVGLLMFKEALTPLQTIGAILGVVALVLLNTK